MTAAPDAGASSADAATGDAAPEPSPADAGTPATGGPQAVLVYTKATGFVHDSIGAAAAGVTTVLRARGITVDMGADPAVFTPAGLHKYAGIILVSTTGKPLGDPGTAALDALVAFVRGGGAL